MDGAKRATAVYHLPVQQMGWISPTVAETLAESFMALGNFKRLEVVGNYQCFSC